MNTDITKKEQTRKEMATNRQEVARTIENLFFEMSRPVESPGMLKSWIDWFQRLHIPCAIARTEAGYTLWRKGKEVGPKTSKVASMRIDFVYSCGLTPRELNLLKEIEQEEDDESLSLSPGGFEDIPLSRWEEPQEGLIVDIAVNAQNGEAR